MDTELVDCYHCGCGQSDPYDTENGFHLVKCRSCGLVFLSPRPSASEITAATKTGQHRGDETIDTTGMFNKDAIARYLDILSDFFPHRFDSKRTWLDIGCGHGEFIASVDEYFGANVQATGCEPNKSKIASAQSRDLDVSFFDLSTHDRTYDVVSTLNVFSHLPNPVETLKEWKRLIAPRGFMFLETGHSSHLIAKDHHKPYYIPDHLSFANRDIVEGILTKIGFRVVNTKIYRHTVFPAISSSRVFKEAVKCALRRPNNLRALFPRHPKRDMFILAHRD